MRLSPSQPWRFRSPLLSAQPAAGLVLRTIGTKIPTRAVGVALRAKTIAGCDEGSCRDRATGSGKSTTLAALVDHINATAACHI